MSILPHWQKSRLPLPSNEEIATFLDTIRSESLEELAERRRHPSPSTVRPVVLPQLGGETA